MKRKRDIKKTRAKSPFLFADFNVKLIHMVKSWLRKEISSKFPDVEFDILTPLDEKMGDYSINLAFTLAKQQKTNPMEAGRVLVQEFLKDKALTEKFERVELLAPGFINFYLSGDFSRSIIQTILKEEYKFGDSKIGNGMKINLEFVSANPTGPLTVGNARAASFGDTLGNILNKTGHKVIKEYYINDIGIQVRKLGESVAKRYLELKGRAVEFGDDLYQGEYIIDIAEEMDAENLIREDMDFEKMVQMCRDYAIEKLVSSAKESTNKLGVKFDEWFSEKRLHDSGEVNSVLQMLEFSGNVFEEEGAKWLKISDDQKAVLVKSDGATTYLLNDIAYTKSKFERGSERAINIWGADHHGDVPRLKAGVAALGYESGRLEILLHQLVSVKKKDELQKMSKRAGRYTLLDDLLSEVGKDAIRFFFLTKDLNTHMEFDVNLAKEQSKQNPVFYIQYAYARLNSIFSKMKDQPRREAVGAPTKASEISNIKITSQNLKMLSEEEELRLMKDLIRFPEMVEDIAQNYQVHHLAQYTYSLASDFHRFYEKHRVIIEENPELQLARLALAKSVQTVLRISLNLMALSTPEKM